MWGFIQRDCTIVKPNLWDYATERLSEGPMEQVERHLTRCTPCRQELEALRQAQNLLATARNDVPAPFMGHSGWADLKNRLAEEGLTTMQGHETRRAVAAFAPTPRRERRRLLPGADWLPSLAMAGGFATVLLVSALTYRALQPRPGSLISVPSAVQNRENTASVATKSEPLRHRETPPINSAVSTPDDANDDSATMVTAPANEGTKLQTASFDSSKENRSTARKSREKAITRQRSDSAMQVANGDEPKSTRKAKSSKNDGLNFEKHIPDSSEQPDEDAGSRRSYVMGTLIPVSHDSDSVY